jgi:hypothetical protein
MSTSLGGRLYYFQCPIQRLIVVTRHFSDDERRLIDADYAVSNLERCIH